MWDTTCRFSLTDVLFYSSGEERGTGSSGEERFWRTYIRFKATSKLKPYLPCYSWNLLNIVLNYVVFWRQAACWITRERDSWRVRALIWLSCLTEKLSWDELYTCIFVVVVGVREIDTCDIFLNDDVYILVAGPFVHTASPILIMIEQNYRIKGNYILLSIFHEYTNLKWRLQFVPVV